MFQSLEFNGCGNNRQRQPSARVEMMLMRRPVLQMPLRCLVPVVLVAEPTQISSEPSLRVKASQPTSVLRSLDDPEAG
jgi:hypothetical protein